MNWAGHGLSVGFVDTRKHRIMPAFNGVTQTVVINIVERKGVPPLWYGSQHFFIRHHPWQRFNRLKARD